MGRWSADDVSKGSQHPICWPSSAGWCPSIFTPPSASRPSIVIFFLSPMSGPINYTRSWVYKPKNQYFFPVKYNSQHLTSTSLASWNFFRRSFPPNSLFFVPSNSTFRPNHLLESSNIHLIIFLYKTLIWCKRCWIQ